MNWENFQPAKKAGRPDKTEGAENAPSIFWKLSELPHARYYLSRTAGRQNLLGVLCNARCLA